MRTIGNPFGWQEATDLLHFCQQICQGFAARLQAQDVEVQYDIEPGLSCELERSQIRHVLATLVEDALDAMPNGGTLDISAVRTRHAVEIEVADSGEWSGCDEETVGRPGAAFLGVPINGQHVPGRTRVETVVCPQGGLARTVVIPLPALVMADRRAA